jgi:hypothetical protein
MLFHLQQATTVASSGGGGCFAGDDGIPGTRDSAPEGASLAIHTRQVL